MVEKAQEFFILSHKRGFWGGNLVWWAPRRMGYTSAIDDAGRYSKAEADDITDGGRSTDSQAVPCELALAAAVRAVPAEYLFEKLGGRKPDPPRVARVEARCANCGRFRRLADMGAEGTCRECWREGP